MITACVLILSWSSLYLSIYLHIVAYVPSLRNNLSVSYIVLPMAYVYNKIPSILTCSCIYSFPAHSFCRIYFSLCYMYYVFNYYVVYLFKMYIYIYIINFVVEVLRYSTSYFNLFFRNILIQLSS